MPRMNPQEIEEVIREYIPQIPHLSLATVNAAGRPWVCDVHFTVDDELNIYFHSSPSSRHSQEIVANPYVAASIVAQHAKGQKIRGVYLEGIASEYEPGSYIITVTDWYLIDGHHTERAQKYYLPWRR